MNNLEQRLKKANSDIKTIMSKSTIPLQPVYFLCKDKSQKPLESVRTVRRSCTCCLQHERLLSREPQFILNFKNDSTLCQQHQQQVSKLQNKANKRKPNSNLLFSHLFSELVTPDSSPQHLSLISHNRQLTELNAQISNSFMQEVQRLKIHIEELMVHLSSYQVIVRRIDSITQHEPLLLSYPDLCLKHKALMQRVSLLLDQNHLPASYQSSSYQLQPFFNTLDSFRNILPSFSRRRSLTSLRKDLAQIEDRQRSNSLHNSPCTEINLLKSKLKLQQNKVRELEEKVIAYDRLQLFQMQCANCLRLQQKLGQMIESQTLLRDSQQMFMRRVSSMQTQQQHELLTMIVLQASTIQQQNRRIQRLQLM